MNNLPTTTAKPSVEASTVFKFGQNQPLPKGYRVKRITDSYYTPSNSSTSTSSLFTINTTTVIPSTSDSSEKQINDIKTLLKGVIHNEIFESDEDDQESNEHEGCNVTVTRKLK